MVLMQEHIPTFCDRMTNNFAQDAFFNERHRRKKGVSQSLVHGKGGRQNEQSGSSSFAELVHLVRMGNLIRITLVVVRGLLPGEVLKCVASFDLRPRIRLGPV